MRKHWMFLAVGCLILSSSLVHADQPAPTPAPAPVVAPGTTAAGPAECDNYWPRGFAWIAHEGYPAMKCKGHRLCDWLTYRSSRCACGHGCQPVTPPLYLYMLRPCASNCERCCAPCASNKCGCGGGN